MPTAMDLVQNTINKRPGDFNNNFSELVTDRVRDIIAGKRVEMAQSVFGSQPPPEPENDVDDNDVDDDLDNDDGDDDDDDQTDDTKETDNDGEDTD